MYLFSKIQHKMTYFTCFLNNHTIFVVTLSIFCTGCFWGYFGVWLKTCTLVLVPLSAFISTFFSQHQNAESNLDNKNIDEDVNLSNELEKKLMLQESQLHEDDHSHVAKNGCREKASCGGIVKNLHQDVGDYSDLSFSSEGYSDMEWSHSSDNSSKLLLLEQNSSIDYSDGSISDEESLIELEIPSGTYLASPRQPQKVKQEEDKEFITKFCDFHKFKDPMLDFIDVETKRMLKQQSIMDLLTEINEMNMEEENLIEIDIAMGSIKYPRFEIEA
ncbi:hypothetical protein LIER_38517 [Lithospermum erythrorhizon]|uniref:Uncharacterized protein n=1 Tax=Lithospermum erythrorhizon TaxID=34254 RepID=A0AAV3Q2Y2_LITER